MGTRTRLFFLALFTFVVSCPLPALPLVIGDLPRYAMGGRIEILSDETGSMGLADVQRSSRWELVSAPEPNLGFGSATHWARFQLRVDTDHRLLLVFQFANADHVDFWGIHPDGRTIHLSSGHEVPFSQRSVAHQYPIFPLDATPGETMWCYVELQNRIRIVFPLSVWEETAFHAADRSEAIVTGILIGVFFLVILFNAIIFMGTTDWTYLLYVAFVICYLMFELAYRDIGGQYIWPRHSWLDDQVMVSAAAATMGMGLVFTRSFLQTRTLAPIWHKIMGVLAWLALADFMATFVLSAGIMVPVSNGLLLVVAVMFIPNALVVFRRGFRAARFYLVAWISMLAGGFVFGLLNFGFIPNTPLASNALTLGASFQCILLSFAVVDRMLQMRRASDAAQHEKLEAVEMRLYFDTLTEFPNRNRLLMDLRDSGLVTLTIVNIDHFNEINDYFGQKAGDDVIRELGNRVREVAAALSGKTYRLHADEFAVVIKGARDDFSLREMGNLLMVGCQSGPYFHENETLRLEVSVGIAVADAQQMEKADMALSVSRATKTYGIYRPELEVAKRYADNLHWLHVIREAIDQDRVVPFFQPIMNNARGVIEKFESLMRIRAADGSFLTPGQFLTVAKKSKTYPELSKMIIEKTVRAAERFDCEVSLNVSLEDILHTDVQAVIERVISNRDVGRRIVFEILESEGIENYSEVSRFIDKMKAAGCKIAIDDFGSGYSNFAHILRLHVDYLKLDASLIKPIAEDENAQCIVETIVAFARKLGIQTIAEYVHNKAVHETVCQLGVDFSQGYYIAQPAPEMIFAVP